MAEIVFNEEKKVNNVTVKGQNITLSGEVIYTGEKLERASWGIQEDNKYIGDVSFVDNHDERGSLSCYICCPPKYIQEACFLAGDSFNQLLTLKATK